MERGGEAERVRESAERERCGARGSERRSGERRVTEKCVHFRVGRGGSRRLRPRSSQTLTSPRARAPRRPRARHERDGRRAGLGRPAGAALAMVGLGAVRGAALHQARGVRGDERCRLRMRAPRACIGVHVMCMWHETQCSNRAVHISCSYCVLCVFQSHV